MTRRWQLLLFYFVVAAVCSFLVIHSVARIEDKYLQTHRAFLDPAVYQEHLFKLWELSHQKSRWQLIGMELSDPAESGEITQFAFRTIPVLLLNPDWLKSPKAQLITSGFSLFVFVFLLLLTVHRRTGNLFYATAGACLFCSPPGIYEPYYGLGALWLDLSAGFLAAAAVLCLINSEKGEKLVWLAG
ncbi:MAG TPA: hypothetical protein VE641_16410, partial [Chthoniobacterales bacterium]|nr:hypothetical protein [Chthoniobacterales bacterium]